MTQISFYQYIANRRWNKIIKWKDALHLKILLKLLNLKRHTVFELFYIMLYPLNISFKIKIHIFFSTVNKSSLFTNSSWIDIAWKWMSFSPQPFWKSFASKECPAISTEFIITLTTTLLIKSRRMRSHTHVIKGNNFILTSGSTRPKRSSYVSNENLFFVFGCQVAMILSNSVHFQFLYC